MPQPKLSGWLSGRPMSKRSGSAKRAGPGSPPRGGRRALARCHITRLVRRPCGQDTDFAVLRYDGEGHLDPGFGASGVATVDFKGREDRVHSSPSGKVVTVGLSEDDFAVARFNGS